MGKGYSIPCSSCTPLLPTDFAPQQPIYKSPPSEPVFLLWTWQRCWGSQLSLLQALPHRQAPMSSVQSVCWGIHAATGECNTVGNQLSQLHIVFIPCLCLFPRELIMSLINLPDLFIFFMQRAGFCQASTFIFRLSFKNKESPLIPFCLVIPESRRKLLPKLVQKGCQLQSSSPAACGEICISASWGEGSVQAALTAKDVFVHFCEWMFVKSEPFPKQWR